MSNAFAPKSILANATWIISGGILSSAAAFTASIFVSRGLSVTDYGILQLATTYFLFAQLLENFAHVSVAKIELLKNPTNTHNYSITIGWIIFSIYFLVISLLGLTYLFLPNDVLFYVIIMTAGQLFKVGNGISFSFDANLEAKKNQFSVLAGNLTGSLYRVLTAIFVPFIFLQTFAVGITNFVNFLFLSFFYSKSTIASPKQSWLPDKKIFSQIIRNSYPLLLISFVNLIVFKLDVILLGFFGLTDEISYYTNAVKLTEPWNFIATAIINSMFPSIILAKKKSLALYYRRLRLLFSLLISLALSIGLIGFLFSYEIVNLTFGAQYLQTSTILNVHIWSNIFLFLISGQLIWEISESFKRFSLLKYILAAIANLGLNIILIPRFGGMGCAISSVVTYFLLAFGLNTITRHGRFLNKQILQSILEIRTNLFRVVTHFKQLKN